MHRLKDQFNQVDAFLTAWAARQGILLLRLSLGLVFLWFGALKFFPDLSPAESLAQRTIEILTLGLIPPDTAIIFLAIWECLIGLGLLFGIFLRTTLLLLWLQMIGAFAPMILFPAEVFTRFPYAPTLEGQYIIKNLVIVSASIVIASTVRGDKIVVEPPGKSEA